MCGSRFHRWSRPGRCVLVLVLSALGLSVPQSGFPADTTAGEQARQGIAILASEIGHDYSVDDLSDLVSKGHFSPVVIDWAWITYHWDRTDFAAVNRFLGLMAAKKVQVAAMYRPRFLSNPTVATQVGGDGKPGTDHAEICYSDPTARKWGISWGEKILQKCPSFKEIIIYNPLNQCHCPKCTAASASGPHTAVMGFLSEAKSAWRAKQPEVKLGVVYMPVPEFWKAGLDVLDVAHPYLCVRENVDPAKEVANIKAVRDIVKEKMGSCLAKVTWEEGAKVSTAKLKTIGDLTRKDIIPYFVWTFDTLFMSDLYDPAAAAQALGMDPAITDVIGRMRGQAPKVAGQPAPEPGAAPAAPDAAGQPNETQRKPAEALLDQIQKAGPGADKFAAIDAVVKKCKESDAAGRSAILSLTLARIKDKGRAVYDRWPYCYVISGSEYEQGVPDLIQVLLHDENETMRGVAAEALGSLSKNAAAHDALLQAARKGTSQMVRDVLARYLGQAMPALEPGAAPPAPASAGGPAYPLNAPDDAKRKWAEELLKGVQNVESGAAQFAAINALAKKARENNAVDRNAILWVAIATMKDKSRPTQDRWPCCYVISGIGDERGVPDLIQTLLHDELDVMRAVAAEALGGLPGNSAAREALLQAAGQETSQMVRDVLTRYLGQSMPAPEPGTVPPAPTSAGGVEELARIIQHKLKRDTLCF